MQAMRGLLRKRLGLRRISTPVANHDHDRSQIATLILIRHGQSIWNANPTFTGWVDVPLTSQGEDEARNAGQLLAKRGIRVDEAFTSNLQRAQQTCHLTLENAGFEDVPVRASWRLNERHYGIAQGLRKDDPELERTYGKDAIKKWRRSFDAKPPPMTPAHPHYQPGAPLTESLADCQVRTLVHFRENVLPALRPGRTVLLAAHANTLRALKCHLDSVDLASVPKVHVPNGVPCLYRFENGAAAAAGGGAGDDLRPASSKLECEAGGSSGRWMLSCDNIARLLDKLGGPNALFKRALFEAWDTNGDNELTACEVHRGLRELMGDEAVGVAMFAGALLRDLSGAELARVSREQFESQFDATLGSLVAHLQRPANPTSRYRELFDFVSSHAAPGVGAGSHGMDPPGPVRQPEFRAPTRQLG